MSQELEFWAFIASNVFLLAAGGTLAALSYLAFRRSGTAAFGTSTVGFATITIGALVEAGYEIGVRGTFELTGRELLVLHTVEGFLIAAGLGLLFYSLREY